MRTPPLGQRVPGASSAVAMSAVRLPPSTPLQMYDTSAISSAERTVTVGVGADLQAQPARFAVVARAFDRRVRHRVVPGRSRVAVVADVGRRCDLVVVERAAAVGVEARVDALPTRRAVPTCGLGHHAHQRGLAAADVGDAVRRVDAHAPGDAVSPGGLTTALALPVAASRHRYCGAPALVTLMPPRGAVVTGRLGHRDGAHPIGPIGPIRCHRPPLVPLQASGHDRAVTDPRLDLLAACRTTRLLRPRR